MANLIEKCATHMVKWCFHGDKSVSSEQEEILIYGYTLFLENLYKAVILLVLAILTKTLWETLLVIGSFVLLRSFSGGIHSHSSIGCTIGMVGVWCAGIIVSKIKLPIIVLVMMGFIIIWTILRYAPQSTGNNPIYDKKVWKYKRVGSVWIMILLMAVGLICGLLLKQTAILNMIWTSLYIEAFSILLLVEKEGRNNEEFKESFRKAW